MKKNTLWRLAVATLPEAEEAVAELLGSRYGQPPASYTDLESGLTTVSIYFDETPAWSRAEQSRLGAELRRLGRNGLNLGPARCRLRAVRREDWAESWKRHFRPMELGAALLIRPSWSRRRPKKGQTVVVLDPGLSFGTGQHPTTAFCLEQLVERRRAGDPQSFLDLGAGSGILAIAAAKLRYSPIEALDFDPEAVRIARANSRKNRVAARIRFSRRDIARLPRHAPKKYSLVCANLIANLLLSERERILARLKPDGWLVLAGILKTEFSGIQAAYEAAGLRLVAGRTQNEWRSGCFTRPSR
jgi:ribosomal protein L11 methyltransferase